MNSKQRLSHALMMRFGLSGSEPSFLQLDRIKNDLAEIIEKGLLPDDSDWDFVVKKYCSTVNSCRYYGLDNSDLNALLKLVFMLSEKGMVMDRSALNKFKEDITASLGPVYWEPSDFDVRSLAKAIDLECPHDLFEVKRIFQRHFPDILYSVFEGVDNSDLKTMLAMVLASARAASK